MLRLLYSVLPLVLLVSLIVWQSKAKAADFQFPPPPSGKDLKSHVEKATIYALDDSSLGDRKPMLFVHGGNGEHKPLFRWTLVVNRLLKEPQFSKMYKVYFYRYNSGARLDHLGPEFAQGVKDLCEKTGKEVTIVALSMGGNLTQYAMADDKVDHFIERVFCIGTPFHGSPLFSSDWFQYSLDKSRILPWARAVHAVGYRLYFKRHKNYLADLKWDNFDNLIPSIGKFKSRFHGPEGDLDPKHDANPMLAKINSDIGIDKKKFFAYAGYLSNTYQRSGWLRFYDKNLLAPYRYFTVKLPAQLLGREHAALKMLNLEMSNLSVNHKANQGALAPYAFTLNDGITPVCSALFLPNEFVKEHPVLAEADLDDLHKHFDIAHGRVFRGMDHVSFLDGKPVQGKKLLQDEAHPDQGRREILDWLVMDILSTKPAAR